MKTVLVTGAGGFLGKAICEQLLKQGLSVRGIARQAYPQLTQMGVTMFRGDLSQKGALDEALKGCDTVFHVAAKAGVWGSYKSYFQNNVVATQNVIAGCKKYNIPRLVYTSTPSVTFAGVDENGINETAGYSDNPLNNYCKTKTQAEQLVLAENSEALATVALRPHLIWGPGDPHLIPRVIARAKCGRLKLVGKEDKKIDTVYIDNAAKAHVLAAQKLSEGCAGKAYFISNDQPITMAEMLNKILAAAKLPPVSKRVPTKVAFIVGAILEGIYTLIRKTEEPIMTRFVAKQLSTAHWFDISAAKKDLGYEPEISIDEGMKRLALELG